MSEHQVHFGRKFTQDKKNGYWLSTDSPRIRAHRWVWIKHFGDIPKGYHVHHHDEDRSNNDISNLFLISPAQHAQLHMTKERRKRAAKFMDKIRPMTKEWHASPEGHAWHKAHGILGWMGRKAIEIKCELCGKKARTKTYHQRFCSNACKSAWRRDQKLDYIVKLCPVCKKAFQGSRYSKGKVCGRKCGNNGRTLGLQDKTTAFPTMRSF